MTRKTKRKFKKCSQCKGNGYVMSEWGENDRLNMIIRVKLMCMLCGGDGKEINEKD